MDSTADTNNANNRYILGLPEMDEQHRYLYDLFDRIGQSSQVVNIEATGLLLKEIERYVLFHFTCEEQLMRMYETPGFAVHQSDHDRAESRLLEFLEDFDSGRLNPAALRSFLSNWLTEHGRQVDAEYVQWVRKRREELTPAQ